MDISKALQELSQYFIQFTRLKKQIEQITQNIVTMQQKIAGYQNYYSSKSLAE